MARAMFTPDEQAWLKQMIDKNDSNDWVKNGAVDGKWGIQWMLMLMFRRGSTGVSFRDPIHAIDVPISICQSLPYRLAPYTDEGDIPFGVPVFPGHESDIPFYFDKFAGGIGPYADLYFLSKNGNIHTADGMGNDSSYVTHYASQHGMDIDRVFSQAQQQVLIYQGRGQDRALSRREIFP